MSTLDAFPSRWDVLWACLHEDTGATVFSVDPNIQSSEKESLRQVAGTPNITSKGEGISAPTGARARGQHC